MKITQSTRRWVYILSAVLTFALVWPADAPSIVAGIGQSIGQAMLFWGLPALALLVCTKDRTVTGISAYIPSLVLWLFFFAAHVSAEVRS